MTDLKLVDPVLAKTLNQASEPLAIWSPEGIVIGYFTPAKQSYRHIQIPLSEEELRRREADHTSKTYTAAEVRAKLEELKQCSR